MAPNLRELIADDDVYYLLLEKRGGSRIVVPLRIRDGSPFCRDFGLEAFVRLAAAWGGMRLPIPVDSRFRVVHLRLQGLSINQIAAKLCMRDCTVLYHLRAQAGELRHRARIRAARDAAALRTKASTP